MLQFAVQAKQVIRVKKLDYQDTSGVAKQIAEVALKKEE